jgi:hypothetical protein
MALVLPFVHRWSRLSVFADNGVCLLHLRQILLPHAFRHLHSFTATLFNTGLRMQEYNGPSTSFQPVLPSSTIIRFTSVPYPLHLAGLPVLRHLELDSIQDDFCPTYDEYALIIGNCPFLEHLQLRWTGCRTFTPDDVPTALITSHSIHTLVLAFDSHSSLGRLASFFRFPRLHTIRVHLARLSDVASAMACIPLLGDNIFVQLATPNTISTFFDALRMAREDILPFDFSRMRHLRLTNTITGSAHNLLLNPVPAAAVSCFADRRLSHASPRQITLYLPHAGVVHRMDVRALLAFFDSLPFSVALHTSDVETVYFEQIWGCICRCI